jgi:hypothetical protein
VGLIVEIEAVGDQFFELDIDGAVEGTSATSTEVGTAAFATVASASGAAAFRSGAAIAPFAWRTIAAVWALGLGRSGTCPTAAFGFVVASFVGARRTVALGTRLGCGGRGFLFGGLRGRGFGRFGSFLRRRSF